MIAVALEAPGGAGGLRELPPLSLYLHLPWCVRKCPYCDFNSHELRAGAGAGSAGATIGALLAPDLEREYVDALIADLESSLELVWGRSVHTIFIGGGTPSLFAAQSIDRLLAAVRARLRVLPDAEVTMEANPVTFEAERFRAFADAGVNRLSIGVQSFDDGLLGRIGRIHDGAQAVRAIEVAARHFATFNIDLMYALPGQSLPALERDLRSALSFAPPHLSCYHLTLEPNTLFAARPPVLPDEDLSADMQSLAESTLADAGLARYEVSAHARTGHRSRHNLNYWGFGDYLGIGAGAHGKLSFHDRIVRYARARHPRAYVERASRGDAVENERVLTRADLGFEFMLNALRLVEGLETGLFEQRTGVSIGFVSRALAQGVRRGLLDADPRWIRPTALGLRFLNDLQQIFLEEER
ncbi:MAG: oxygen-independent coproporphyrinogen III oxidase-like protein [Burkholderiaceae bacterium]|nr:oxygen-independent coproporphyrinogen III oxidase-like protein [Burkholderiaceae bacterium]